MNILPEDFQRNVEYVEYNGPPETLYGTFCIYSYNLLEAIKLKVYPFEYNKIIDPSPEVTIAYLQTYYSASIKEVKDPTREIIMEVFGGSNRYKEMGLFKKYLDKLYDVDILSLLRKNPQLIKEIETENQTIAQWHTVLSASPGMIVKIPKKFLDNFLVKTVCKQ